MVYCCWSPGEIHNSRAAPPQYVTGAARELCINNVCICISSIRFLLYNIDVTSTSYYVSSVHTQAFKYGLVVDFVRLPVVTATAE